MLRILAFSIVVASAASFAQVPPDLEAKVDEVAKTWDRSDGPGGIVGVAKDGKVLFAKGYGLANLEYGIKNTPDTVMDVGSVSKQFTAMCILLLEEEGKLKTSDDIRKYVPEVPSYGPTITIDHLLHMTSGLRDYLDLWLMAGYNFVDHRSFDDAIATLSKQTGTNSVPGERFNYCNAGYMLMAVVVERVSGKNLASYARENVFKPLGMDRTLFMDDDTMVIKNRATSYAPGPLGIHMQLSSALEVYGDGGVHTTIADMVKWHENFYANKLGKGDQALVAKMVLTLPLNDGKPNNYACGLIVDSLDGEDRVQHNGNWLGYNAATMRFPDHHLSVFAFGNDGRNDCGKIAADVARLMMGKPIKSGSDKAEIQVEAAKLEKIVGSYSLPGNRSMEIDLQNGQLGLTVAGQPRYPMFPKSETTFFLKVADVELDFHLGADGKVASGTLRQNGADVPLSPAQKYVPTADDMKAFEGAYFCSDVDVAITVWFEEGKLQAMTDHGDRGELVMRTADECSYSGATLKAERDASGRVRCLVVDMGRAQGMKFVRRGSSV